MPDNLMNNTVMMDRLVQTHRLLEGKIAKGTFYFRKAGNRRKAQNGHSTLTDK